MSFHMETQQISRNKEEEDFLFATQLATGSMFYMAMQVAVELDLFGIIQKAGPNVQISPRDIASQLPTKNPSAASMLDRILRLLASYSILKSTLVTHENGVVERLYGLTSVCRYFVPNEDGVSLSALMMTAQDNVFLDSWSHMKDAILEGGVPFEKAHGIMSLSTLEDNGVFNRAMFNHTKIVMKKILEIYKGFEDLKVVIDVAGGVGTTISLITSKYHSIKGINFDLPHVIDTAPSYPGVEHTGGCMFESVPNGDAIFMKCILHDWSDENCVKLLSNCYKALPEGGKVIVVEAIVPVAAENDIAARGSSQYDVVMMAQTTGGKERTEEEFQTLAMEAGFACIKKVCSVFNYWVIEFYKI
ncbi:caffeate O-methyltransferase [Ranunculus cassubicifolius]